MPVYHAYGLQLDSDLELPELLPSDSKTSTFRLFHGKVEFQPPNTDRVIARPLSEEETVVYFKGVGAALIHKNGTIVLDAAEGADALTLRLFVLQQVLGVALLQRGYFVLHAAAAVVNGMAVAFCGSSGQGKSTMTAALSRLECPVLTDDVLAVDMSSSGPPMALPGLLQLKLTEATRAEIGSEIVAVQTIRDRAAKKLCAIRGVPIREAVPLHSIYLLETGTSFEIRPTSPARSAIELVRQTYGADLLPHIGRSISHFEQCASLARAISISVLSRPRDLGLLDEIGRGVMARVRR